MKNTALECEEEFSSHKKCTERVGIKICKDKKFTSLLLLNFF